LIVNRFFGGAQIPTGRMAEDVGRVLAESGYEVTALASSGAYEGAAQALKASEDGVSVKQCFSDAVKTEIPADRTTEAPGPSGTLRVETVRVPTWMPRALAWLWFTWQARKRIPRMDWDVCVLMTDPPLLPLLVPRAKASGVSVGQCFGKAVENSALKNRTEGRTAVDSPKATTATPLHRATRRVAVWLMDLYPEALAASGRLSAGNPLYRWYFEKRQRALAAADLVICLGHAQKELLGAGARQSGVSVKRCFREAVETEKPKHCPTEPPGALGAHAAIVPPWDDRGNIALATEESLRNLALYAGNLGEAHCFEEILAAAPYLPGNWKVRFAVRGAKLAELKEKAKGISHRLTRMDTDGVRAAAPTGLKGECSALGDPSARNVSPSAENAEAQDGCKFRTPGAVVHVSGYASEEETPGLLASARVHLITMSPGWEGIVVPSKLYGCIRTGRPVLFMGPENADTAREICANDWGMVLPPRASGEKVAGAILELAARPTKAPPEQRGAVEVAELIKNLGTAEQSETDNSKS
jgi:hypothetical protein